MPDELRDLQSEYVKVSRTTDALSDQLATLQTAQHEQPAVVAPSPGPSLPIIPCPPPLLLSLALIAEDRAWTQSVSRRSRQE